MCTPEDIERVKLRIENNRKVRIELEEKEKEYRELTNSGNLILDINWCENVSDIDIDYIKSKKNELSGLDKFEENYQVAYFDLDTIVNYHCEEADVVYPRNNLWDSETGRSEDKTTRLITYIKEGKYLCPPIIEFVFDEFNEVKTVLVHDGNHRIALCRFLGLKRIPFVFGTRNNDLIQKLIL